MCQHLSLLLSAVGKWRPVYYKVIANVRFFSIKSVFSQVNDHEVLPTLAYTIRDFLPLQAAAAVLVLPIHDRVRCIVH